MKPKDDGPKTYFLLGNVILATAAVMLFFFGTLWEQFGVWALMAWMALAVLGVYFISRSSDPSPPGPPN
jgi:membrane protein implicated in regulation of membrane protease activity